ncbi:MAG: YihY/virulence factor BrkB family protein [Bacteroidaceae bacterium]|nr:YihY/virulence factor BrkB family protein [Bacteroidaceae bacterium]
MVSLEHIWSVNEKGLSPLQRLGLKVLKRFVISWECITKNNIMNYASALTYSSMLAAVPVMAIVFAIARGFGFDTIIESKLREVLEGNPDIADTILYFVDSYLQHTKGGVVIGIGLVFLLYTLISLTSNIENAFNRIWFVKRSRSIYRQLLDYISIFRLCLLLWSSSAVLVFSCRLSGRCCPTRSCSARRLPLPCTSRPLSLPYSHSWHSLR